MAHQDPNMVFEDGIVGLHKHTFVKTIWSNPDFGRIVTEVTVDPVEVKFHAIDLTGRVVVTHDVKTALGILTMPVVYPTELPSLQIELFPATPENVEK